MKPILLLLLFLSCLDQVRADFISADPPSAVVTRPRNPLDEDTCPPQTIVSVPLVLGGNTSASVHNYTLNCGITSNSRDDIYALSLSCITEVTVSTCDTVLYFDTVIQAYRGTNYFNCPGTPVVCNDDACGPSGLQSRITFTVQPDEFWFIVVSGYNGGAGDYLLNVTGVTYPPINDNCSGAKVINELPYSDFGSTTCANNSFNPSSFCGSSNARDVLYRINMPCNANLTVTTCGHPLMDALLHVYKYGACPGTNFVVCNDDACANNQSLVTFNYEANQDFYIVVDGWSNNSGFYVLNVYNNNPAPADSCPGVQVAIPSITNGNTGCESDNYAQFCSGHATEDIYWFTVEECRNVTASLCGSSYDTELEIYYGNNCPGELYIACNDDYCGLQSQLTFEAVGGETYFVRIGGFYGAKGAYTLTLTSTPCELAAPESLVVRYNPSSGYLDLNWSAVAGANYYEIYGDSIPDFPIDPIYLVEYSQFTFYSVPPDPIRPKYFYKVVAVASFAQSAPPPVSSTKIVPPQNPEQQTRKIPDNFDPLVAYPYASPAEKQQQH